MEQDSGRYTTTKLDPFYQMFLRNQFQEFEPVFKFPKATDLQRRLEVFLQKPPKDYRPQDYGEWTFKIMIPRMEHKNADTYNYLSKQMQKLFEDRVRSYFRDLMHNHISRLRRAGFNRKEIIIAFMEDYNIDMKYYDRIEKDHKRYMNAEAVRRYKHKEPINKKLSDK